MTVRVDNVPLIPGAVVIGATGRGILGSTILLAPVPGREPSVLASSVTPGAEGSEFRAKIVSYPSGGDLFMWEDGSYTYSGPPGTLVFERYRDGALLGTGSRTLGMAPGAVGRVMLVDTSSLVPGAVVVGVGGFGVLGHAVLAPTPPGRHTSLLASAVTTSAESSAYRVVITDKPAGSSLYVWEDGTYTYSGPPGTVSFDRYRDGLLYDTGSISVGDETALSGAASQTTPRDAGGVISVGIALSGAASQTTPRDAGGSLSEHGVLTGGAVAVWAEDPGGSLSLARSRARSPLFVVYVNHRNAKGFFVKAPNEILDFDIDFTKELEYVKDVPLLVNAISVSGPTGMVIDDFYWVEETQRVKLWFSGGKDSTTYDCTVWLATRDGRRLETDIEIQIED